jgi:aryl-alcohol dehydrogenase-like predicted oxidoreductase
MRFLEENKYTIYLRIKTIQNPYSLLNRLKKISSEICAREMRIAGVLLSMGFGVLSGKFLSRDSHPKQDLVCFLNTRDTVASKPQLQQNYTKK